MSFMMRAAIIIYCIALTFTPIHQVIALSGQSAVKVSGVLLDPQDARIVCAIVRFRNESLNRKAYLNEEGIFETILPLGTYEFTVQSDGFKTFSIESLEVKAEGIEEMKIHLESEPEPNKWVHSIGDIVERIEAEKAPVGEKIKRRKIP